MKIGIQQTTLGEVSLARCFLRAKRAGADGVGLCYRTAADAALLEDPAHAAKVRRLVERYRLAVTGLHLGVLCAEPSLIGPDSSLVARSQELIRRAIAVAASVGGVDVIVPFYGRNRIELPKELDTAAASMSALAPAAEDQGLMLAVESSLHLGQIESLLGGCCSDSVQVCLDVGDVTACRRDSADMILGLGRDRVAQVHIKDVCLVSGLPPDFNVRLGHGSVCFGAVAHALRSVEYEGWLVLETPPGDERGAITAAHVQDARALLPGRQASDSGSVALRA
ncbi:MAG: sugar phosphate isomerase/epimerase [Planctomycetaceae bacterium]|nr:sugar phosphate isomerase/epimerase [Planctomycetaceae bacterium]